MVGERMYRALLFLYPRRFRREYRHQMVQLYADARRDRTASWLRLASDVIFTVPRQHQEAFMHLDPGKKLGVGAIVLTSGIVSAAFVGGSVITLILMMLLAWTLVALLKTRETPFPSGAWWKLAASGLGLFATLFAVFAPPWPESWRSAVPGEVAWAVGFFGFIFSIVLIAAGLLGGIAERVANRGRPAQ